MEAEKIRNMSDTELDHQQRELNDQLFRLKFQLKMGQTESLKKIRGLRKDVARIQTIMREKQLGLKNGGGATDVPATEKTTTGAAAARKKTKAKAAARRRTAIKKKSAASKRTATKKRTKKPAAKATRKK
jgi:large subunit ribosomal protein L29